MPQATNQIAIFLPVLALVALTFVGFVRLIAGRMASVKAGQDPAYYRAHLGPPEPETAVVGVRHWSNLFELPTLFYAACVTAFLLQAVGPWTLGLAWGFVALRIVQSVVHMTYNTPTHRGYAFLLSVLPLFALWVLLGCAVFARL